MKTPVSTAAALLALLGATALVACKPAADEAAQPVAGAPAVASASKPSVPDSQETRAIARDAYTWGYPLVEGYKTMYQQAVDTGGPNFHAPFNKFGSSANVATPKDTAIITPNSDTPYSFLWMDLRAEPVVISLPEMGKERYSSVQLVDLYTYNFAYINKQLTGGKAGSFMVAGPNWNGNTPPGVSKVFRAETPLVYALVRTQLFSPTDLENVKALQAQYKAQPLSSFLGTPAPAAAPAIDFPPYDAARANGVGFFEYLNFLLQFAPTHPNDAALRERFARIGIEPGKPFNSEALPPQTRQALLDGIADANKSLVEFQKAKLDTHELSSADLFGTREVLGDHYDYRFAGAKLGIYGNSASEADYKSYFVDAEGNQPDGAAHDYVIRFGKDQLPPTSGFWSITMYDGKSKLLVDNPIDRYLINSPMLSSLKRDADGGLTLYLQHASPGKGKESNWLPTPAGPFYAVLRNYSPSKEVVDGTWKQPPLVKTR